MSTKVYRLLRNNKEEGPFTAEELILKNLQPYDLIWTDGSSAAWRYPGEMAQFKIYAPLPGEENIATAVSKVQPVSLSVQAAIAVNNNLTSAGKEKPRYKVSAAWSRIQTLTAQAANNIKPNEAKKSTVKKNMVISQATGLPAKSLSWEEAWLDWENEKKSVNEISQTVPARPVKSKKNYTANKRKAETKQSTLPNSSDDKYTENLLQQKPRQEKKFFQSKAAEFALPALALIIIFSAAYWLLNSAEAPVINTATVKQPSINTANRIKADTLQNKKPAPVTATEVEKIAVVNKVYDDAAGERKMVKTSVVKSSAVKPSAALVNNKIKPSGNVSSTAITSSVAKQNIQNLVDNVSKTQKAIEHISTGSNASGKTAPSKAADGAINENKKPAQNANAENFETSSLAPATMEANNAKAIKKITTDYVKVPEHITMENGIANINIQNISDVDLDLVVIDVQYFNALKNFRKGETFYLHNLKAGRNVTIKTSKDATSTYAIPKISLISSDTKQVYVVGDN